MSNGSAGSVVVLALVAGGAWAGYNRKLPLQLQATWDKYIGGGATTTTSGGVPTTADIATWSKGIGLPTWVGTLFVAQFGRLPASTDELNTWGKSKGYQTPTGSWVAPAGVS